MNGNVIAPIAPHSEAPAIPAPPPQDRPLVALLKLTAAADRLVAGSRGVPLPDRTRALVDQLAAAATEAWDVLGHERRMADGG